MIIKAKPDDIERCHEFAEAQYVTSRATYARRGQANRDTIIRQIEQGKIAELMVYHHLRKKFNVDEPDFNIYKGKKKSFAADLTDGFLRFHIKGQDDESARRYGISWVFTPSDPLVTKPMAQDIMVLVLLKNDTVKIEGFLSALTAKEQNLYEDPKLERLRGHKVVLYMKRIATHIIEEL